MEKTKLERHNRIQVGLTAILSFAVLTLTFACVFSEKGDGPESTYGWSWESGSNSVGAAGVYGTKGTASSSNFPGARGYHTTWVEPSGAVWLFGGHGFDSADISEHLNDLWKYAPSTQEWTWVSGSSTVDEPGSPGIRGTASPTNVPGARDTCASWIDASGKLWVFGGFGFDSTGATGNLNDLWMFDPTSREWTWVSGNETSDHAGIYGIKGTAAPANAPGARYGALSWLDSSGKFWLFGGFGSDSVGAAGYLNDLWRFDPTTSEWTWISGSELIGQAGVYGTKGTASLTNIPGARDASASWRDSSGELWLFGGAGHDGAGMTGQLSDLWKCDPTTLEWTWVSGSNTIDQPGIYGTQGTGSPSNNPGGNNGASSWLDPSGKLWLFGGIGFDSTGTSGSLNALWKFDPATSEWTWVSGSEIRNHTGDYGTQGKRSLSNSPGGREYFATWADSAGNLWLFGGRGYSSHGSKDFLNDLWKYTR